MNGERRMRLTERYMDPPGQAMPDCLIAARVANHMERVLREQGKGGEFVTYARLRIARARRRCGGNPFPQGEGSTPSAWQHHTELERVRARQWPLRAVERRCVAARCHRTVMK
jgi:hypothetical protein